MAKIVIIAPKDAEEMEDAVKVLRAAGHTVETQEPTPKSLLHIVLGLFGPKAYGFGEEYIVNSADNPPEEDEEAEPAEDEEGEVEPEDDFRFESLGETTVDGELIEAVRIKSPTSLLYVEGLVSGSKTSYRLNESTFSFWPADVEAPAQRVQVQHGKHRTSIELVVKEAEKAQLQVGDDLASMFEAA